MDKFEKEHIANQMKHSQKIEDAFIRIGEKIALIANDPSAKFQKAFQFKNNLKIQKAADKEFTGLAAMLEKYISESIVNEWNLANLKNDYLVSYTIKSAEALGLIPGISDHNIAALKAFSERAVNGLKLSERVWKSVDRFRDEMEAHLAVGITNGDSAAVISRRIREYLNEPEKLFRRVRDKKGNLVLSKNAKVFHPGPGAYRSSYKNARRLAVTETNIAYRKADIERWKNNPTIVGFEVHLSGRHIVTDICNDLKGRYPKGFIYTGWHPHCLCYSTPIMLNDKEFDDYTTALLNGEEYDFSKSTNSIKKPNSGFNEWKVSNIEKLGKMEKKPYFVLDNPSFFK